MPSGTVLVSRLSSTVQQGGWTRVGGTTAHGVLSDDLDSTYLETTTSRLNAADLFKAHAADFTVPAGAKIFAVQVRVKVQGSSAFDPDAYVVWSVSGAASKRWDRTVPYSSGSAWSERPLGYEVERPGGGEWTAADANALQVWLGKSTSLFAQAVRISEVWLDLDYNLPPAATVTGPSGTLGDNTRPSVTWTYTDPEGDPQEAYRLRVFTAATVAGGGFSPETSTAHSETVWTLSAALVAQVPAHLPNGAYHAYLQVRQQWEGVGEHRSAWAASAQFTIDVQPPPLPTLSAVPDPGASRVLLSVARGGTTPATESYDVEFSDDAGVTWQSVRSATGLVPDAGGAASATDWEAPPNRPRSYRVSARRLVNSNPVASAHASAAATLTMSSCWLKDPLDPLANRPVRINQRRSSVAGRDGVFRPLGRRTAVVVSDEPGGWDDRLRVLSGALGGAEHTAVAALLVSRRVLLYQRPNGTHRYVRVVNGRDVAEQGADTVGVTYWDVECVEVDRPV